MTRILIALVALAVAGCVPKSETGASASCPQSSLHCSSDADCAGGEVCGGGCCQERNIMQVDFQISPPIDNPFGVLEQQVLSVNLSRSLQNDICLKDSVLLSGKVTKGEGGDAPLAARIAASLRDTIPGTRIEFHTDATSTGEFSLNLEPGTYTVFASTMQEQAPKLPPMIFKDVAIEQSTSFDIAFPSESELILVWGRVVTGVEDPVVVPDVNVIAFDPVYETASSSSTTGPLGWFSLLMLPKEQAYTFRISGSSTNSLWPEVDFAGIVISEDRTDVGDLSFGNVELPVDVTGIVVGNAPLPQTVLNFEAPIGNGRFRAVAQTDEAGMFSLKLHKGLYSVTIVPPEATQFAITELSNVLVSEDNASELRFDISTKTQLSGHVFGADGVTAASGVGIDARRTGGFFKDSGRVATRQTKSVTDEAGFYQVELDPGIYDISAVPPPSSGFARKTVRKFTVSSSPAALDVTLFASTEISGLVRAADCAEPVPDTSMKVFSRDRSEPGTAILIGEGITDDTGRYAISIPNPFANNTTGQK